MNNNLQQLCQAAFADGNVTENEIDVLLQKAEESGENQLSFKKEMMTNYFNSQIARGVHKIDRESLRRVAEKLGLNFVEYDMIIDLKWKEIRELELGTRFIEQLKNDIHNTKIYAPTGKYGKMELSTTQTLKAKADLLLYATPSTPPEIYEYVAFISTFDFAKYPTWRKQLHSMTKKGLKRYPNNELVMKANNIVVKAILKRWLPEIVCSVITVVLIVFGVLIFKSIFWQIVYFVTIGLILLKQYKKRRFIDKRNYTLLACNF